MEIGERPVCPGFPSFRHSLEGYATLIQLFSMGVSMPNSSGGWLPTFAKYGGFGGLVLFVFVVLFSKFGDLKPLFGNLNASQTYNLIVFFMLLVFFFSVFGLVVWVIVNNQKRELRAVRTGLLVLMALILCGVAAWATINGTREHIVESLNKSDDEGQGKTPQPLISPPDLESGSWKVGIRTSVFPPFEGKTTFRADHTFDAVGQFLVPTDALNQHVECPGNLGGTWSYATSDRQSVTIENLMISHFSDYQISKDQYQWCASKLGPLTVNRVSKTCAFKSDKICMTDGLEIHLEGK